MAEGGSRPPAGRGLVVAVVGSDGSGKSTLSRRLRHCFPELDVVHLYLGSGDGPSSLLRWPLKQARRIVLRTHGTAMPRHLTGGPHRGPPGVARTIWALALSHEKRSKLRRAKRARDRGALVICDRYPQTQFPGTNDGPLLADWSTSPNRLRRVLAAWEARPYDLAHRRPPDLVLRLRVDEGTAVRRRPRLGRDHLRQRGQLVQQLRFEGATFGVVELDSSRPPDESLRVARAAIMQCLSPCGWKSHVIEFCGVPGSGKSFLVAGLASELCRRGEVVTSPLHGLAERPWWMRVRRKLARAAVEAVAHPVASVSAIRLVGRSAQMSRRDVVVRTLNWLVLRNAIRQARRRPGTHIFDQGLLQELCSLAYRGDVRAVVDLGDPSDDQLGPDHVVVVGATLSEAGRRLRARAGRQSRVERSSGDGRVELERFAALIDEVLPAWVDRFGTRVPTAVQRVVNDDGGADLTISEVADAVVSLRDAAVRDPDLASLGPCGDDVSGVVPEVVSPCE